jgi:hypothetical protein
VGGAPILWTALLALFLATTLAWLWPLERAWGLDAIRYLPPPWAGMLWLGWGLALIPAVACRVEANLSKSAGWLALPCLASLCLVLGLHDRLHFLGDWLMRRGSAAMDVALEPLYPQALPLDLFLHVRLPRMVSGLLGVDAVARIAGGIEALLLVASGWWLTARSGWGPGARFAALSVAIVGGFLQLFTGFNKAASEMCVLAGAATALAVAAPASGAAMIGLGGVAAIAVLLHRVGVLLVPAVLVAVALRARRSETGAAQRWIPSLVAATLPALSLAAVGPKLWHVLVTFDLPRHIAPPEVRMHPAAALLAPAHLLDVANALAALAPVALVSLLATPALARRVRAVEIAPLAGVVVPMAVPVLAVHPQQGLFRDLDVVAPSVVALAFLAAWVVGRVIADEPRGRGLTVAVTTSALACAVAWMGLHHDPVRGAGWARRFTDPAAHRSAPERALTWDFLGFRAMAEGNWPEAWRAWSEAARLAPSPRILTQLAMAETMTGRLEEARERFRRVLELDPGQTLAVRGIATTSFRLGDYREARRAAARLQAMGAAPPELADLLRELDRIEAGVRPSALDSDQRMHAQRGTRRPRPG